MTHMLVQPAIVEGRDSSFLERRKWLLLPQEAYYLKPESTTRGGSWKQVLKTGGVPQERPKGELFLSWCVDVLLVTDAVG